MKKSRSGPDYTASVKMGVTANGQYVITGLSSMRKSTLKVEQAIKNTAKQDTNRVKVMTFQDPAAAGKGAAERFIRMLGGFDCDTVLASVDKETNCKSFSAQAEHGNILVWSKIPRIERELFYTMLESFPDSSVHDDYVDAGSGAFNALTEAEDFFVF